MVTPQIYPPPSYTDLGSVVHWHHSLLLILLTPSSFMDNVVTVPTLPISHPMTLQCPCGEPRVPTCSTLVTIFTPSTSIPCLDLLRSLSSELPRMSLSHSLLYWMAPWRSTTLGTSVFRRTETLHQFHCLHCESWTSHANFCALVSSFSVKWG
jgi:hypothetical protein